LKIIKKWATQLAKATSFIGHEKEGILRLAVLISGKGTNLLALAEAINQKDFPAEIRVVVVEDLTLCKYTLEELKKYSKNEIIIKELKYNHVALKKNSRAYWSMLQEILIAQDVEMICLAGFMHLIPERFIKAWTKYGSDRCLATTRNWKHVPAIINIHPSLLPSFKGLNAVGQALDAGTKFTGCTIHFVDSGMDSGPIIAQGIVPIKKRDTVATLTERIQKAEHYYYKQIIKLIAEDKISFTDGGKVVLDDNLIHNFNISYPAKITQLNIEV